MKATSHPTELDTAYKAETGLRTILASMADLVFAFDCDGRFTFHHTPKGGTLYRPAEEFLGRKHSEVMPPHLDELFAEAFDQNRKGEVAEYEYGLEIGGELRWFFAKLSPVFTGDGFQGSVAVIREITERKEMEEALRDSQRTAQALLDAPTDAAGLVDRNGTILAVNDRVARRFGKRADELVGRCVWDLLPPPVAKRRRSHLSRVVQTSAPVRFEDEHDGLWNDNVVYPITDAQGEVTKIAFVSRDITDRRRAEEVLREAHEQVELRVAERTAELMVANEQLRREISERERVQEELQRSEEEMVHAHDLMIALCQAALTAQRARTVEEVYSAIGNSVAELGCHAMIFLLTDDRQYARLTYTTVDSSWLRRVEHASGIPILGSTFPLPPDMQTRPVIADGEGVFCERTAELVVRALPGLDYSTVEQLVKALGVDRLIYAPMTVNGRTEGLLGVASGSLSEADVSAVTLFASRASVAIADGRLLEQSSAIQNQLRRLTHQVMSAQEEERLRLARALHDEAGQALTALRISLDLVGQDLPKELGDLRRRVADATALADGTMEQLRLLAQNLRPPALDTVGIGPALEGFCYSFAERTQMSIKYRAAVTPALADSAGICLYRFVQEALTNVARHAYAKQVWVELSCEDGVVSVSVADNGRGFDPRSRWSATGQPTGIGLLGMQERLEALGGRLEVESRPSHGTRVVARLPVGDEP